MAGHMPLTNGATAAKEAGYRVGKSKKNPEMATDAADTSAGRSPKRRAAKSDSRPNRMRPAGKRKSPFAMPSGIFTPHAHPGKSKTSPDQLTKRRFQYPEPVLNSPKLRKHNKLKINHNRLHINV
ncbi:hypothetical protein [Alistipes shahii]|uniref:hypothetical protein n=1 Tax=Alistipes shahii TaxID=328814 RepID=UPI0040274D46